MYILARSSGQPWIIFVFLAFWLLSSIAGWLQKKAKKQEQRNRPIVFQPRPDAPQMPNRPEPRAVPKVVVQTVIRESAPKPVARVVAEVPPVMSVPAVVGVKAVATRPAVMTQGTTRIINLDPKSLRQQIVMKEILSPPVALREDRI